MFAAINVQLNILSGFCPVQGGIKIIGGVQSRFPGPQDFIAIHQAGLSGRRSGRHFQNQKPIFIGQPEFPHYGPCDRFDFQADGSGVQHVCSGGHGAAMCSPGLKTINNFVAEKTVPPVLMRHLVLDGYGGGRHYLGYGFSGARGDVTFVAVSPVRVQHLVLDGDGRGSRLGNRRQGKIATHGSFPGAVPSGPPNDNNNEDRQGGNGGFELAHAESVLNVLHNSSPQALQETGNNMTFIRSFLSITSLIACIVSCFMVSP